MIDWELSNACSHLLDVPVRVRYAPMTDAAGKAWVAGDSYHVAINTVYRGDDTREAALLLHELGHIKSKHLRPLGSMPTSYNPSAAPTPDSFTDSWLEKENEAWDVAIAWAQKLGRPDIVQYARKRRAQDYDVYIATLLREINERLARIERQRGIR